MEFKAPEEPFLRQPKSSHTVLWQRLYTKRKSLQSSAWSTGFPRGLPLASILALIAAIIACGLMVRILVMSDGQPVERWLAVWKYQPTVFLAIAYTIANVAIQFAFHESVATAWWVNATKPKTTLRELHNNWAFGNSFIGIICAGRGFNMVAFAGLAVTLVPANGPLLQRASAVKQENLISSLNTTIPIAQFFPAGFTGTISARGSITTEPTANFSLVLRDFSNRRPVNITNSGCRGVCKGSLLGAGYAINCTREQLYNNDTEESGADGVPVTVFNTTFWEDESENGMIYYQSMVESVCKGSTLSVNNCTLTPATIEYPVQLTNDTVELDPGGSFQTDRVVTLLRVQAQLIGVRGVSTHGGMWLALQARYNSYTTKFFDGVWNWQYRNSGTAALDYHINEQSGDCSESFNDVTVSMLDWARELAFRSALFAAAHNVPYLDDQVLSSDPHYYKPRDPSEYLQRVTFQQTTSQIVYRSQYLYLGIAVALTIFTALCVSVLFFGWWSLGRNVSLSPIEIAKAFDAPGLSSMNDPNADVKTLLKYAGDTKMTYGVVWPPEGSVESPVPTLKFADPEHCQRPQKGQVFTEQEHEHEHGNGHEQESAPWDTVDTSYPPGS
jgi:hypothetical protein